MNKKYILAVIFSAIIFGSLIIFSLFNSQNQSTKNNSTSDQTNTPQQGSGFTIDSLSTHLDQQSMNAMKNNLLTGTSSSLSDLKLRENSYTTEGSDKKFILDDTVKNISYAIEVTPAVGKGFNYVYVDCAPDDQQIDPSVLCSTSDGNGGN